MPTKKPDAKSAGYLWLLREAKKNPLGNAACVRKDSIDHVVERMMRESPPSDWPRWLSQYRDQMSHHFDAPKPDLSKYTAAERLEFTETGKLPPPKNRFVTVEADEGNDDEE